MNMDITDLQRSFDEDYQLALQNGDFDALFLKYFSKKNGLTTQLLKSLKELDADQKRELGPKANKLQIDQKNKIEEGKKLFSGNKIKDANLDISIPTKPARSGMLHPTTILFRELNDFFRYSGFSVVEGRHIESAEYNFRKLNLPKGHPATDLQDTLFIHQGDDDNEILLRTHTSSVESRILSEYKPPIRVVVPGYCYRNETLTASNSSFFTQYQGFVVDKGITMQHLKDQLEKAHKFLFGDDVILRWRYKYYPEVSPGLGVDMMCKFCSGAGCEVCKHRGWIETLGSGMIHYNTLKMCGIDPEVYSGYAFGMGSDRFVMQRFGIDDIRKLYGGKIYYK